MARSVVFFGILCLLVSAIVALEGPSDFFSESDSTYLRDFVLSNQKEDGTFGSIENTFYAVGALKRLGFSVPNTNGIIKAAKAALSGSLSETSSAISILKGLGSDVSADAFTKATATLDKLDESTLEEVANSVLILARQTPVNKKISSAVERIFSFMEADGTFKNEEDGAGDLKHTVLALRALSAIPTDTLSSLEKETLDDVANKIADLISLGTESDNALSFSETNESTLRITGALVESLNQFAGKVPKAKDFVSKEDVVRIAEFLTRNKYPHTLEEAYFLVAGLQSLASGNFYSPVVLSLTEGVLSPANKKGEVTLSVTDLFGKPVNSKVYLSKAYSTIEPAKILLRNQEVPADGSNYKLNFLAAKPEAGFYTIELSASPVDQGKVRYVSIDNAKKSVKVLTAVDLSEAELSVFDPAEELPFNKIQIDSSVKKITFNHNQRIHLTFKLKNQQSGKLIRPQQVFVQLANANEEATFVAIAGAKNYAVDITLSNTNLVSGTYSLSLIVGDAFIQNPFSRVLATVEVSVTNTPRPSTERTYSSVLSEIHNIFRAPEKRPPETISLGFAGAVLVPILVLFVGLIRVGANLRNFPGGLTFFAAIGFHACLFAILALVVLFWTRLSIVDTLRYLAILAVPTVLFGQRVLLHLHTQKVKKD